MPTIALRFPAGRYHATPWGSHVNEALVEWPPSPWRILRALLATGFSKFGWQKVSDDARQLVEKLTEVLPSYRLPHGEVAHTRHYMPIIEGKKQGTTKVFDAFIRLSADKEMLIQYPCNLPPELLKQLEILVTNLSYFGRAESWAEARIIEDTQTDQNWCQPCGYGNASVPDSPGGDQVSLIAPLPVNQYDTWRTNALQRLQTQAESDASAAGKKHTKKQQEKLAVPYPVDIMECLLKDTAFHQKYGWSQPPGSHRVLYVRPAGILERQAARPASRRSRIKTVEAALMSMASDTVRGDVLPLMERCLPQAELLHQALISSLDDNVPCKSLRGCDDNRIPLKGHRHAHYLPLDLNEDGRMDHILVYAPMGLNSIAQAALTRIRRTWTKGSDKDIIITCAGMADIDLFRKQIRTRGGKPLNILDSALTWSSVTPFVPPRHIKPSRHTLEDQVKAELKSRKFPQPISIEILTRDELVRRKLLKFVRKRRSGKPQPPKANVLGLRLVFPEPVTGPITLGYASHYGLGVFAAEG